MSLEINTIEIKKIIYHIRGKSVMFDEDLARLYQVPTYRLNEAVKRNQKRFPEDFMFQLTTGEFENLRSQFAISNRGGRRYLPFAFTEQGVAMLSGVLKSNIAIDVSINIMRIFVHLRRQALSIVELNRKLDGIEQKYDKQFKTVFDALRLLLEPPINENNKGMGFTADK